MQQNTVLNIKEQCQRFQNCINIRVTCNTALCTRTRKRAPQPGAEEAQDSMKRLLSCSLVLVLVLLPVGWCAEPSPYDARVIKAALESVRVTPQGAVEYDYVMTARVRLLVFWAGKDDVGGGFIRHGRSTDDPRKEFFQVLFGSDPAKAPRAINRWGAGTEVSWHRDADRAGTDDIVSSAFFGFMKSSKGKSASEMQEELRKEKEGGGHLFTGILSTVEKDRAASLVVPLRSDEDFSFGQYDKAEPLMLEKLRTSERPARELATPGSCSSTGEFLTTVSTLVDGALAGHAAPASRCYVYDAQQNTLTLERTAPVRELHVQVNAAKGGQLLDKRYEDLIEAEFTSEHALTKKRVHFTIVVGTKRQMRGVPVQIRYQPNWWFQVVLNLRPPDAKAP